MEVVKLKRAEVIEKIIDTNGRFFSVDFIKREDGTTRHMTCRCGVKKHIKGKEGKGPSYDPADYALIPVFDTVKGEYRSIPTDSLLSATIAKVVYEVEAGT